MILANRPITLYITYTVVAIIVSPGIGKTEAVNVASPISLIFQGTDIQKFQWSDDGSRLVFFDNGFLDNQAPDYPTGQWLTYDTSLNTVSSQTTWPLIPQLTSTEQQLFDLTVTPSYLSPDKRYLVYAGGETGGYEANLWNLFIGDRTRDQHYASFFEIADLPDFSVLWSKTNAAFVLQQVIPGFVFSDSYFTNYGASISNIQSVDIDQVTINGQNYTVNRVFDISDDGTTILAQISQNGVPIYQTPEAPKLLFWNLVTSDKVVFAGSEAMTVIGASFLPDTTSQALAVDENGITQYDSSTGQRTVIDTHISSSWGQVAVFSPDRTKLAMFHATQGAIDDVFVTLVGNSNPTGSASPPFPGFNRLTLETLCAPDPNTSRVWQITNANPYPVYAFWLVNDAAVAQQGSIIVSAADNGIAGEATFQTQTDSNSNTVTLYSGDNLQDSQDSNTTQCAITDSPTGISTSTPTF